MAGGPAKLNENTKIARRNATLSDDFYGAAPGTGLGFVSSIAQLLSLIAGQAPTFAFADNADLLANVIVQPNYFTYTINNGSGKYEIRLFIGGDRANIANYKLVMTQDAGFTLAQILTYGNTAGAQIKSLTNATDPQDAVSLSQMQTAIAAVIQHFKGTYLSSAALTAAHPTAIAGDYAYVDAGIGSDTQMYIWDADDVAWKIGTGAAVPDATSSVKGIMKLYAVTGANTDGTITQAALTAIFNLKSDSTFTYTNKTGNYTMAAAEVAIIDAGGSLIMESTTGDLTLPNGLIAAGKSFGVRGFANMVNGGTMVITGTNGTLVIPSGGRTCIVEVLSATTARLHNGTNTTSAWSTVNAGQVEESTQAESEAVASQGLAGSLTGLSASRAPSEIGLYYFIRKVVTLAWNWSAQQTHAIGLITTDATASTPAWFNASKKLVTAVVTDMFDWLGVNPISVAVSLVSTTVTLDCNSKYKRKWHTVAAHTANFSLTKTNKTNFTEGEYNALITGTVVVQLDTDDRMPDDTPGWNYASKQLTLVSGGTGLAFCIAYNKMDMSSVYQVVVSTKTTV